MRMTDEFPYLYYSESSLDDGLRTKINENVMCLIDPSLQHMQSIAGNVISNELGDEIQDFVKQHLEHVKRSWNINDHEGSQVISWNLTFYPKGCCDDDKQYMILNHVYNSVAFKIVISPCCEEGLSIKNIKTNDVFVLNTLPGQIIFFPCSFIYPVQIPYDFDMDILVIDGQVVL